MKSKLNRPPGLLSKTGVMAFLALTLAWLPQANAGVTAGAIIENVATVTWQDSTGVVNPAYTDDAFTQVTVNLVASAATLSGQPTATAGQEGDKAPLPAAQTVLSGATATYWYAVTATANGSDSYDLTGSGLGATNTNATGATVTILDSGGAAIPGNSLTLASAIVHSVTSDTQLVFPGGAVADFAVNDVVVINGFDYVITGISANNAPNHGTATTETQATITFGANAAGFNTAPLFQSGGAGLTVAAGDIVGEQQLIQVQVTATVTTPASGNAIVGHDVVVTDSAANVTNRLDTLTNFEPLPTVTISKLVRNVTDAGAFAATANGDPGDILEYQLTITNSGSTAEAVVVTDPLPTYTNLVRFSGSYGGGAPANNASDFFAQAGDGVGTVDLTVGAGDDEDVAIASGDFGVTNANTLTFFVGDNSINASGATTGGDVPDSATFTVIYRVQILP